VIQNLFAKLFLALTPKPTTLATFDCRKQWKMSTLLNEDPYGGIGVIGPDI
jgi:hypothetical protein